jgi:hypothetical protein
MKIDVTLGVALGPGLAERSGEAEPDPESAVS